MMRRLRSTLPSILIFAGALVGALLLYGLTAPIKIRQPSTDGSTIVLESGVETGQRFTAHYPGLSRISVQAALLPVGTLDVLTFRLRAGEAGAEVLVLTDDEVRIEVERDWIHIRFPPQRSPASRLYSFYLADGSAQPIILYAHAANMYPEGTRIGGEGDLVFEAGFRPSAKETLAIMLSHLTEGKPGLLGNPWTYVLLLIAMTATFIILAGKLFRLRSACPFVGE